MLRPVSNAKLVANVLIINRKMAGVFFGREKHTAILEASDAVPVLLNLEKQSEKLYSNQYRRPEGASYWVYKRTVYVTLENLQPKDVTALVLQGENLKRLKLEKAHALMAMREHLDSRVLRQPIPQEVKQTVWIRDKGRCTQCGSQQALEFDHIIPLALSGSNTERNLQLLCEMCNRRKGPTLG